MVSAFEETPYWCFINERLCALMPLIVVGVGVMIMPLTVRGGFAVVSHGRETGKNYFFPSHKHRLTIPFLMLVSFFNFLHEFFRVVHCLRFLEEETWITPKVAHNHPTVMISKI